MRIALSIILYILSLTFSSSVSPRESTGAFADWLAQIHFFPDISGLNVPPCWPAVWLTFFYGLFFSRLFVYLNRRDEETLYSPGSGYPLGGWILFLGFSLSIGLLFDAAQFFLSNYYSYDNWVAWQSAGGDALEYLYLDLTGRLLLIAMFYKIHIPSALTVYRDDLPWALARTAVYATIWVTYVLRSDQVKSTFLESFRQRFR